MTVQTSTRELLDLIEIYRREREAVAKNVALSKMGQSQGFDRLKESYTPRVEGVLTALWGDPQPLDNGGFMLSADGEAWRELASAEENLNMKRQEAARAGIDPLWLPLGKARAHTIIAKALTPQAFIDAYNLADQDAKLAMQEFAAELLAPRRNQSDWWKAIDLVDTDRKARLNSPAVQAADERVFEVADRVYGAYVTTQEAQRTFAIDSWVLVNILGGVAMNRQFIAPSNGSFGYFVTTFERQIIGTYAVTDATGKIVITSNSNNNGRGRSVFG